MIAGAGGGKTQATAPDYQLAGKHFTERDKLYPAEVISEPAPPPFRPRKMCWIFLSFYISFYKCFRL